jgi:hypothetical protein
LLASVSIERLLWSRELTSSKRIPYEKTSSKRIPTKSIILEEQQVIGAQLTFALKCSFQALLAKIKVLMMKMEAVNNCWTQCIQNSTKTMSGECNLWSWSKWEKPKYLS